MPDGRHERLQAADFGPACKPWGWHDASYGSARRLCDPLRSHHPRRDPRRRPARGGSRLRRLVDIEEAPDPAGYDAVVLGSGVRVESIEKSAAAWAKQYADALSTRPFAFFSCSGSASDPAKGGKRRRPTPSSRPQSHPRRDRELPRLGAHGPHPAARAPDALKSMRTPTGSFRDLPAVAAWGRRWRRCCRADLQ